MSQKKVQLLNPLSGNINVAGVITASSFVGSGEGLTGVASTDNIQTATEATFLSGVKITGVTTASGGVVGNLTGTASNATLAEGLTGTPNITVGSVTAASGSFSGNVTIGGTLTYQDVEHIDSVGIITAQQGIQVLANGLDITGFSTFNTGVSVTGVVTATSFSGSGANLTDIQSGTANFVASGAIPGGATVVINTDGTVGIITATPSTTPTAGDPVVFESAAVNSVSGAYDSTNNKVVIAYMDDANSDYGTAIVGTVSGTSISFGDPVVFESANTSSTSVVYDSSNEKVVIAYKDNGNSQYGTAIVGTVSGTSISFGSAVVFESAEVLYLSAVYDSTNEKVVIAYRDVGNTSHGTAIVGTVSGTSISFGSAVVFESANTNHISATFDSTNSKVVIAYQDTGNSSYGTAIVGTVSGTSISFGTAVVFESATTTYCSAVYDSSNEKVVIAYTDSGNSSYGTAIVGTVTGTAVTFGSPVVFESANSLFYDAVYDSSNNKVVIAYSNYGNSSYGTAIVGTVSGDSISFGSAVVFESAESTNITTIFDSSQEKIVVAYQDAGNSNYGTAVVIDSKSTNLTTDNYIGISAEAIADGATGSITIVGGINTLQTGLTTAQKHFVQRDGTISTSVSTPSVVAGTAVSATQILVR